MAGVTVPRAHAPKPLMAHFATPPTGDAPWPGVVVLHEAFGLNDDIRDIAGRLAAAGYLAVAPSLYSDGGPRRCLVATFRALMRGEGKAFDDIEAARSWLAARDDCSGRVGVIGFCMGGGFALAAATRGFAVSAPNYGQVPKDLDDVLRGACPVVASFGGRDRGLRGAAERLEQGLRRAGVAHDVKEYPGAGHSFLNRHGSGPLMSRVLRMIAVGYHAPAAEDAWDRILAFFDEHLHDEV